MQRLAQRRLWRRVSLTDGRHYPTALLWCSGVGHQRVVRAGGAPPNGALVSLIRMPKKPVENPPATAAPNRRPVAVDLFSGAGGLSLGFEQAGFDVVAAVEYDPIAAAVHKFNFPRTEVVCADVATLGGKTVADAARRGWAAHHRTEWDGTLDVVIGGPPCQGFSLIGRRAFDDARNQLVFHFARIVGWLKPRYFVMENVPGMKSVMAGESEDALPLLDLLIEEFQSFGYNVLPPKTLNAYNFGVPQDRARLILTGYRSGEECPDYPPQSTVGRTRQGQPLQVAGSNPSALCPTVWDAIGDLPNANRYRQLLTSDELGLSDRVRERMDTSASAYVRALRGIDPDPSDLSWKRHWESSLLTSSLRTIHAPEVVSRFAATPQGRPEQRSRLFRLHPNGVSSTLRAGTHYERGSFNAPRPIHPTEPRVITVREAARLHSYPDWFRLNWTKWHGFREIGNSLPPRVGRAVGIELVRSLGLRPRRPRSILNLGDLELLYLDSTSATKRLNADPSRAPRHAQRRRRQGDPTLVAGLAA